MRVKARTDRQTDRRTDRQTNRMHKHSSILLESVENRFLFFFFPDKQHCMSLLIRIFNIRFIPLVDVVGTQWSYNKSSLNSLLIGKKKYNIFVLGRRE